MRSMLCDILTTYVCIFPTDLLDEATRAQAEADGLKMKLRTSDDELISTKNKLDTMRNTLQGAYKERDDATSQLSSLKKNADGMNGVHKEDGKKNGDDNSEFLQHQYNKVKT